MTVALSSRLANDVQSLSVLLGEHGSEGLHWWGSLLQWRILTVEALVLADRLVTIAGGRRPALTAHEPPLRLGDDLVRRLADAAVVNLASVPDECVAIAVLALALRGPALGVVALDLALRPQTSADSVAEVASGDSEDAESTFEWPDHARILRSLEVTGAVGAGQLHGATLSAERRPFFLVDGWLYAERYLVAEVAVAEAINERVARLPETLPSRESVLWAEVLTNPAARPGVWPTEDNRQALAAWLGVDSPLFVLIGGPGTGKTTTLRAMLALRAYNSLQSGLPLPQFALAAPTGKAAARMKESLAADLNGFSDRMRSCGWSAADVDAITAWLAGMVPSTVHRLIGKSGFKPTRHNAFNPLAVEGVVIDEASMVDLELMGELLAALPSESQLWLLGDRHQLASVEVGSVLADITRGVWDTSLASDHARMAQARAHWGGDAVQRHAVTHALSSCVVELVVSRRFDDRTVLGRFATALVGTGSVEETARRSMAALGELGEGRWRSRDEPLSERLHDVARAGHVAWLAEGYAPYLKLLQAPTDVGGDYRAWHLALLEQLNHYRVLTGRRGTRWGVNELNEALQAELLRVAGRARVRLKDRLWVGMPVLIRSNDYDVDLRNGDVGICVGSPDDAGRQRSVFSVPTHVVFPDVKGVGGVKYVAVTQLPEHEPALAMTVHKSQGSEFDAVGLVVAESASALLNRELIYTGLTRSRGEIRVLGSTSALETALQSQAPSGSLLWRRLWRDH